MHDYCKWQRLWTRPDCRVISFLWLLCLYSAVSVLSCVSTQLCLYSAVSVLSCIEHYSACILAVAAKQNTNPHSVQFFIYPTAKLKAKDRTGSGSFQAEIAYLLLQFDALTTCNACTLVRSITASSLLHLVAWINAVHVIHQLHCWCCLRHGQPCAGLCAVCQCIDHQ